MNHTSPELRRAIDEAELDILLICKSTTLYGNEHFTKSVDDIIESALAVFSVELKTRFSAALRKYATQTLRRLRYLLFLRATFLVRVAVASEQRERGATHYERQLREELDLEYFAAPEFIIYYREAMISYDKTSPTALPLNIYHRDYQRRVRTVTERLIRTDAKEDYTSNISLRNVAEMTVRHEHQTEMIERFKDRGTRLVYIVPHANASARCEKYQVGGSKHPSGLYSLDGTEGVTAEGIKYLPLEFATDNPEDRHMTKDGKVYQNGCITGFNCRHTLSPYIHGQRPRPIPEADIARRRAVEEKQREYERRIREYKRAAVVSDKRAEAAKYREKSTIMYSKYKAFCTKNEIAYYPERTRNFD